MKLKPGLYLLMHHNQTVIQGKVSRSSV